MEASNSIVVILLLGAIHGESFTSSPIHSILVSPSCRSKVQQTVAYSPSWLKPRVAQHRALAQIIKMYTLANRIS